MMDETTIAALLALAIGLVKIVERLTEWGIKKLSPDSQKEQTVVQLDRETTRILHEVHARTVSIGETVSMKDPDGTPMVYSSRSVPEEIERIAVLMTNCVHVQQRLLDRMERVDDKIDEIRSYQRQSRRG